MKRMSLVLLMLVLFTMLKAQEETTRICQGATLEYAVTPYRGTSSVMASLSIERLDADSVTMIWAINDLSGRRAMLKNSIEKATMGYWSPPINGEHINIPEQQTFLCISRNSFAELKQKGTMEFDGQVLELINTYCPLICDVRGKKIIAIRAESESGTTRIWISDDAFFPVILKLEGNPFHVDLELTGIK
jgi:hypothetical protein